MMFLTIVKSDDQYP